MDNVLIIKNLKKIYHTKDRETLAVQDFTFDLKEGEFVAIVGPSGCGKSTILSILCGLEDKSDGKIVLKEGTKIGYMLQQDSLFEWRNILNNCLLGLEINKNLNNESKKRVIELLTTYGLKDFIYSYPDNLSGGMRQRVALIRTLALKPTILLLDEAFSALDYQTRLNVCDDVYRIIKAEKLTTILVTHDISEAISMSDKIIVLSKRPAEVKDIITINIPLTTPFERRESIEAKQYFEDIWRELK
jgi:NitT/TauT family transport system ATP-binding protein